MVDRTKILSPGQMHGLKPWRIQLKNCPSQIATVPCRFTVTQAMHPTHSSLRIPAIVFVHESGSHERTHLPDQVASLR